MKRDPAHEAVDEQIKKYERRIKKEYKQAQKELEEKVNDYFRRYKVKYDIKLKQVADGTISKADFDTWVKGQLLIGERWQEMQQTIAEDMLKANAKARSMALGYQAEAYALNHNYATFLVEKDSLIDTSYTLYDRRTVERLMKNERVLPKPGRLVKEEIARGEAIRWQKGQIQSVVLQGILQGESIPHLTKRLSDNLSTRNYAAAVRYARTAITGAENAGRLDALKRAISLGIETKKQWLATPDDRTRDSHREVDGEIVGVDEKFSNGLEYPGDPNGAPEEVWNCRCTTLPALDMMDNDISDLSERFSRLEGEDVETYEKWKQGRAGGKAREDEEQAKDIPEKQLTFAEKINKIKKEAEENGEITEEHLKKAGKVVMDERAEYLAPRKEAYDKAKEEYEKRTAKLRGESNDLRKKINEMKSERYAAYRAGDLKKSREIQIKMDEMSALMAEKEKAIVNIREELKLRELRKAWEGTYETNEEWLLGMLSKVRTMGVGDHDIKAHLGNSKSSVRKSVEEAYTRYPTDWVKKSVERGTMTPRKVNRGYYSGWEIAINGETRNSQVNAALHELGHRFEDVVPGIKQAEATFYNRRTAGEDLKWMGSGYRRDEKTRRDNFLDSYMGKDYGGNFFELVSMGFQLAYQEPDFLAQDKDMAEWIYGILALM